MTTFVHMRESRKRPSGHDHWIGDGMVTPEANLFQRLQVLLDAANVKQRFNRGAADRVLDELRAAAYRAGIAAVAALDRLTLDLSEDEIDSDEGLAEIRDDLMQMSSNLPYLLLVE